MNKRGRLILVFLNLLQPEQRKFPNPNLDKFEDGHLVVHPRVLGPLLAALLPLVAGLVEVGLTHQDQT